MDGSSSSSARKYKPYFAPHEVAYLISLNAGKLTPARVEATRQLACGLIDKIGGRLGFPRRTIATAQVLYHRFHLFFPIKDFAVQDVAVAALLVSSKLEDTLKKLREIQIAAFQVKAASEGVTALMEPDQAALEADRARLIGVERLILETISFNFNLRSNAAYATRSSTSTSSQNQDVFAYVIKLGRYLGASKDYVKRAFRMAIDAHRTVLPLSYPPHAIAAACIYLTSYLTPDDLDSGTPAFDPGWADLIRCNIEDVEDVCHGILDLMLSVGPSAIKTSPSEHLPFQSPREGPPVSLHAGSALTSELTQIKIRLRDHASRRLNLEDTDGGADGNASMAGEADGPERQQARKRQRMTSLRSRTSSDGPPSLNAMTGGVVNGRSLEGQGREDERVMLGRDDVTVRFLWE